MDDVNSTSMEDKKTWLESAGNNSFQFQIVQIATSVFLSLGLPVGAYTLLRHFYYGLDWLAIFSFRSADPPSGVAINPATQPLGIHYFGDYLLPHHWSLLANPWLMPEFDNYPPVAHMVFRLFGFLSYKPGLLLFELLMFTTIISTIWLSLSGRAVATKLNTTLIFGLLSAPVIISIDRGNIVGFLAMLLYMFAFFVLQKRWTLASLVAAIAVGIKLYPLVIFGIFLVYGKWKQLITGIITSLVLVVGCFALYPGGFANSLAGFRRGLLGLSLDPIVAYCGNNSLTGGFLIASEKFGSKTFSNLIATNSLLCGLAFSILLFVLMIKFRNHVWLVLVLTISTITATPPIVYGYAMIWVVSALAIVFYASGAIKEFPNASISVNDRTKEEKKLFKFTAIYLSVLLVPFPIEWHHAFGIACVTTSISPVIYFLATCTWVTYLLAYKTTKPVMNEKSIDNQGS